MAPGSKEIFVGNIPFTLSEEHIKEILGQAGVVTSFRLMTDQATGKPRGYGFATYQDADMAASAVRNLSDFEVNGRKIRVDWPHQNTKDGNDQGASAPELPSNGPVLPPPPQQPILPPGVELPPNVKATDAISQTLSTLSPQMLLDILTQMKSLAISEPGKTQEILQTQPQLAYAIFQALLLMGLVDEKIFQHVLEQPATRPAAIPVPPHPQQHPPMPLGIPGQYPPPPHAHQQFPGQYPFQPPPPPIPAPGQIPGQIPGQMPGMPGRPPTVPGYGGPPPPLYPPPQPQAQHQQPPPIPQPAGGSNDQLLQSIMAMTQGQIDRLNPTERAQVIAIREQLGVR